MTSDWWNKKEKELANLLNGDSSRDIRFKVMSMFREYRQQHEIELQDAQKEFLDIIENIFLAWDIGTLSLVDGEHNEELDKAFAKNHYALKNYLIEELKKAVNKTECDCKMLIGGSGKLCPDCRKTGDKK